MAKTKRNALKAINAKRKRQKGGEPEFAATSSDNMVEKNFGKAVGKASKKAPRPPIGGAKRSMGPPASGSKPPFSGGY